MKFVIAFLINGPPLLQWLINHLPLAHWIVDHILKVWDWIVEIVTDPTEIIAKVIAEFLVALVGGAIIWGLERIHKNGRKIKVWWKRRRSHRKLVLFWIDLNAETTLRVANRLRRNLPFAEVYVLSSPTETKFYPMNPKIVEAVILISTDVTKLSSDDKGKEEIEKRLDEYVRAGGGVVAAHDVVYRRTRNDQLCKVLGGQAQRWEPRTAAVKYEQTAAGKTHPIGMRLPETMEFDDGEVLCVDWSADAEIIFRESTPAGPGQGVVVSRRYGKGRTVWLNSGDYNFSLARNMGKPDDPFLDLLTASTQWVAGVKPLALGAPLVVAHRGVSAEGGENTMKAFSAAIELHADYIETDIRSTSDGVLVLHHDEEIGGRKIAETEFADLTGLATAAGLPLAKLEELLTIAKGNIGLDLEVKVTGCEAAVAKIIRDHGFETSKFVVTSFHESVIREFKNCYPEARCGLLIGNRRWWNDWFPAKRVRGCGAQFVAAKERLVTARFARRLAQLEIPIWVWTVNDANMQGKLLRTPGVEAVITDAVSIAMTEQARARAD